jgi:multicomponent Na+:H+ antiporter subunit C
VDKNFFLANYNYWAVVVLMMSGFYVVLSRNHLIKKIVGLNVFQVSVFLLYISVGKIIGGTAPILTGKPELFSNPLPHVLILTAIVVAISTTAIALSLAVRIHEAFGTLDEAGLIAIEHAIERESVQSQ